ncbi:MAG: phasin family protein [Candidatus Binatia bacterium]
MAARKKAHSRQTTLVGRVNELQRTVERRMRKRFSEATNLLPPAPRKALERWTANLDRTRRDLRKRTDRLVTDARTRAERVGGEVQDRIGDAVKPLTSRLDVASRSEVDRLRKRVHELERRVESHTHEAPTPA